LVLPKLFLLPLWFLAFVLSAGVKPSKRINSIAFFIRLLSKEGYYSNTLAEIVFGKIALVILLAIELFTIFYYFCIMVTRAV
jgi:hypothetical protein